MRIGVLSRAIGVAMAVLALLASVGPAAAAAAKSSSCFRDPEIEAQEAIRYQAKLMVLSDTCGGEAYRRFTVRNRDAIVHYQHELIERYKRTGSRHAETSFDSYLTGLANENSLSAGREPLASLCSKAADFVAQADTLDRDHFHSYISSIALTAASNKADYPRCAK